MKVIGLCGGSGSGKGTVSGLLLEYGIPSIDTDRVYREMTESDSPCMAALVDEFGSVIRQNDGGLDRVKLASVVFCNPERLKTLNHITHRFILDETRRRLAEYHAQGYDCAFVDAPALFESGFDKECDAVVCVIADTDVRVERIIKRDGISRDAALKRIGSQISNEELIRRSDYVIYNNGDLSDLRVRVSELKQKLEN